MFRRRIMVLAALAVAAWTACDIPTEPPMWEQTWVVPGETIVVGVASLLPAGVSLSADGTAFETTVPGFDLDVSLGEMCADCGPVNGTTADKPAFSHTVNSTTNLPSALVSASVVGEAFDVLLAHNLSFDPLRPSSDPGAERGYLVVRVTSGGNVVASDSLSGDDWSFAPGEPLVPMLSVNAVDVTNALDVAVAIYSPAGDPVEIDTSDTMGVSVFQATVSIAEATVEATAITVDAPAATMELDVDSALASRVRSGALRLDARNPFDLEGTLDLEFDLGTSTLQRSVALTAGESSTAIEFTGAELRDILAAESVTVTAQGTLASPDGTVTLAPGQELVMESTFEIVVLVGGSEGED